MTKRSWIFAPIDVVRIVAGVLAYVIIAEAVDFDLLGFRGSGTDLLEHRLMECLLLWGVVCSIVGWTKYLRNHHPDHESAIWPILVVPLVISLCVAALNGLDVYSRQVSRANGPPPMSSTGFFWLDVGLPIMSVANPLLMGGMIAALLGLQAKVWRQPIKLGVCPICNYDHRGNASGVCPECGTEVVTDPTIPRVLYQRRFWWTPELAQFSDVKSRHEALKQAQRECRGTLASWIGLAFTMFALVCIVADFGAFLGSWRIPVLGLTGIVVLAINLIWQPILIRRSLRRELQMRCQEEAS